MRFRPYVKVIGEDQYQRSENENLGLSTRETCLNKYLVNSTIEFGKEMNGM